MAYQQQLCTLRLWTWKTNKQTNFCFGERLRFHLTHHLQHLGGDHLHAAHGRGQSAHDGGDDVEGANTKEQLLKYRGRREEGEKGRGKKAVRNTNSSLRPSVSASPAPALGRGGGLSTPTNQTLKQDSPPTWSPWTILFPTGSCDLVLELSHPVVKHSSVSWRSQSEKSQSD